jgi:hypothetical protein
VEVVTVYINNAFSPNMVDDSAVVRFTRISEEEFNSAREGGWSVVGHPDIAREMGVEYRRENISLLPGDTLFIATPGHRPKSECHTFVPKAKGWIYRKCEVLSDE